MPCIMGLFTSKVKEALANNDLSVVTGHSTTNAKFDPDEKWSNLYREREKNHLYKWIDSKGGGDLLEIYDIEGDVGVRRFAQEKLVPLMYGDGRVPERIRLTDYVRWKKTMHLQLSGKQDNLSDDLVEDANSKFREHIALWRLNKRGVEGETIVHLLLVRDDPICSEIAKVLLNEFPGLALDIYEGEEMFGQSALHLAIMHDDLSTVVSLLELGADVNQRATGRFFLPEDQKLTPPQKTTDYIGYAYYGEYPLAFAACFGSKDIYDILVQKGGDPNLQDSYGNTVLHMCVINNSIEMYTYAVRHWSRPANVNVVNEAGYTPLTLAAKLGRKQIFEEMLELTKVEFWRFSDVTCSAYPLTALDTIKPDGSTNWDSALMTIINGSTPEHLDMVESEVIQRLLADKWKAYVRRKLFERLGTLCWHLFTLCFAIYTRPKDNENVMRITSASDYARFVAELLTVIGCGAFIIYQQAGEIKSEGIRAFLRNMRNAPSKAIFTVANCCILLCVPCRIAGWRTGNTTWFVVEEGLLVLALPGSWAFLLFFARGILLTGPFVQMIYRMIGGDMIRFAIISVIFLLSFSQAFYFVGKDMYLMQSLNDGQCSIPLSERPITTFSTFWETFMALFRASMGGYDYEEFDCAHYETLTKLMFVLYMIIMPIMLINMLIAMMGNTYTTVISQAEKAWRKQWAQIVILLERAIKKQNLATYQLDYSIKLADAVEEGGMETRGLMVIKQTKKTRAKQRKSAVSNWKRVGRKVISCVQQDGVDKTQAQLHHTQRSVSPVPRAPSNAASGRYESHVHLAAAVADHLINTSAPKKVEASMAVGTRTLIHSLTAKHQLNNTKADASNGEHIELLTTAPLAQPTVAAPQPQSSGASSRIPARIVPRNNGHGSRTLDSPPGTVDEDPIESVPNLPGLPEPEYRELRLKRSADSGSTVGSHESTRKDTTVTRLRVDSMDTDKKRKRVTDSARSQSFEHRGK